MRPFRLSFFAGLLVLALSIASSVMRKPEPCGALAKGYAPIIAFELARTRADLVALFGAAPGECRAAMVATMDLANWSDLLLFMPAYGVFLALFFVGMRPHGGRIATFGMRLSILAVAADVVENLFLFRITANVDGAESFLTGLAIATGVKWVALALAGVVTAILILAMEGRGRRVGALCSMVGLPVTIATLIDPNRWGPFVALGIGLSWVVVLVVVTAKRGSPAGSAGPR